MPKSFLSTLKVPFSISIVSSLPSVERITLTSGAYFSPPMEIMSAPGVLLNSILFISCFSCTACVVVTGAFVVAMVVGSSVGSCVVASVVSSTITAVCGLSLTEAVLVLPSQPTSLSIACDTKRRGIIVLLFIILAGMSISFSSPFTRAAVEFISITTVVFS